METASKFAEPEANAEIDSLDLKRRQILLYLIDCLGSLRRQEIEKVAAQLAKDNGTESTSSQSELILRPLYDTCLAAGIFENEGHEKKQGFFNLFNALHRQSSRSRHLHDDPVLQLVALCYYPAEMQYTRPREVPASLAEAVRQDRDPLAGEGPARPLIQEIYSLESSGLVRTRILDDKPDGKAQESYLPTSRGHALAEALRSSFAHVDWKHQRSPLVVVNGVGQKTFELRKGQRSMVLPVRSPDAAHE